MGCALVGSMLGNAALAEKHVFYETFSTGWEERWVPSSLEKYTGKVEAAKMKESEDFGLKVTEKAKFYGLSSKFTPIKPGKDTVVLQYELALEEGLECGGAYLKFLSEGFEPTELDNETPYSVMFGPDKCGSTNKVHFIFRHKNPKTGEYEEHHLKSPPSVPLDKNTHLYTAVIYPDNKFEIMIDGEVKSEGNLLESFDPPVNPPKEIDDPEDKKPSDWVDESEIPDPEATKPDDWDEDAPYMIEDMDAEKPEDWLEDEPVMIDDPHATAPEDWDEEEDGEWQPPQIENPKCTEVSGCGPWKRPMTKNPDYKGKWTAPMIPNPEYKGEWEPRQIPNPDYFEDTDPIKSLADIEGVAVEIWTMSDGMIFDNILVTSDKSYAKELMEKTWKLKNLAQKTADVIEDSTKAPAEPIGWEYVERLVGAVPFLSKLKADHADKFEKLKENYIIVYSVVALNALVSLLIFIRLLSGKPKSGAVDVGKAKKEDITEEDDPQDQDGKEDEEKEEEDKVKRRSRRA